MPLQRARFDASLGELVRRARDRREAFDLVAFAFGGIANRRERRRLTCASGAFERRSLVAAGENLIDRGALALIEVCVVAGDGVSRTLTHELPVVALAGPHPVNRFLLELHYCRRGERPSRRS